MFSYSLIRHNFFFFFWGGKTIHGKRKEFWNLPEAMVWRFQLISSILIYCQFFLSTFIILIFPISILSQGFKEHGWPDDSVVIQKSMYNRRSVVFLRITFYNVAINRETKPLLVADLTIIVCNCGFYYWLLRNMTTWPVVMASSVSTFQVKTLLLRCKSDWTLYTL